MENIWCLLVYLNRLVFGISGQADFSISETLISWGSPSDTEKCVRFPRRKNPVSIGFIVQKWLVDDRVCANFNKHLLLPWFAEGHLRMYSIWNLEVDGLQQPTGPHRISLTPAKNRNLNRLTVSTGHQEQGSWRLEIHRQFFLSTWTSPFATSHVSFKFTKFTTFFQHSYDVRLILCVMLVPDN